MPTKRKTPVRRSLTRVTAPVTGHHHDAGLTWDTLAKMFVALALFFTPLLVTTHLTDAWEEPKTILLITCMGLAWLFTLIAMIRRRETTWSWHPLDWFVVIILLGTVVGTWLSVSPMRSLWGIGGWWSGSLPAMFAFASLYFLAPQLFRSRHDRLIAWTALIAGTVVAMIVMVFQINDIALTPTLASFGQLTGTLTNSISQTALLAGLFGAMAWLFWPLAKERWSQLAVIAAVIVSWLALFFLRQPLGWAVYALGMVAVVMNQTARGVFNGKILSIAIGTVVLGIVLQLSGVAKHANLPSASDTVLDQTTTMRTALTTTQHRTVLGSGPSTWYDDFVQYRPASFNSSPNWSLRFIRGSNQWSEMLATGGVLMVAAWLGFLGLAAWWIWTTGTKEHATTHMLSLLVIGVVVVTGFVSVWSWVLLLWLWAVLGLTRADLTTRREGTPMGAMGSIGLMVVILALGWYGWSAGRVIASDVQFVTARNEYSQAKPIDTVLTHVNAAVRSNPKNSNALILLANAELTKGQLEVQAAPQTDITTLIQSSVNHVRQAIAADPKNPATYEESNNLLNRLAGVVSDVATEANRNFLALEKLEPTNPIHDVGEGQTLMVMRAAITTDQSTTSGTTQKQQYLNQALAAYQRALSKKPDYVQAQFAYAQALDENKQSQDALELLQSTQGTLGSVGQYWAERAVVEAHLKDQTAADAAFAQAVVIAKTDATIYSLYADGLVSGGDKAKAKTILQQGLLAIPTATALQQQLDQIK